MYESEATAPVYAALALLSADQTGKSVVTLTTNGPVTAADDIDVLKGTKEVEIDKIDYEDDGAKVTLKDSIKADAEYTVILNPADEDDEATTATFTGEKAQLKEIRFLNKVLVMKDHNYNEGYAYVKGYDQFDDPVTLSGLTVTPGVGQFKSYDNATGKITIVDNNYTATSAGAFMLIKEVPMFVQVQSGNQVITASETLTVSTQAFVNELTFGEIKKDGTAREDGRLTIDELGSRKYYVEIEEVKDQYGNDLDADDLNEQKKDPNKTLFVIPSTKGAYFTTADFGTVNEKTVLWLAPADDPKPGTMALTITGAGGQTFTKDITVDDNPYINVLNVTYPELYENAAESAEFDFSAVDQYGEEIDLWDYRPTAAGNTLIFKDENSLTKQRTKIQMSAGLFNYVVTDGNKKTSKVTVDMTNNNPPKANTPVVFTVTTAGMKVATQSVMVGTRGTSAKIKSIGSGTEQLVKSALSGSDNYDFNGKLQFEDANGNTMKRTDGDYPAFAKASSVPDTQKILVKAPANFKADGYFWTLATNKVTSDSTLTTVENTADKDGVIEDGKFLVGDMLGAATKDVWVILWGVDDLAAANPKSYLIDQKEFHFTQVMGNPVSYTAKCDKTLYVQKSDSYKDSVSVSVTAKTDKGESYAVKSSLVTLGGIPFETSNTTVYGNYDLNEVGTKTATVFVSGEEATTVNINYTNVAPVPSESYYKYTTKDNGNAFDPHLSKYGTEQSANGPDVLEANGTGSTIEIKDGQLSFANANSMGDTITAGVKDQYENNFSNVTYKANGVVIDNSWAGIAPTKEAVIEWAAGSVTGKFKIINYTLNTITATVPVSKTVTSEAQLVSQLAAGVDKVTLGKEIETAENLIIPAGTELVIPAGLTLETTGTVDNSGKITVNGTWASSGAVTNNGDDDATTDATADATITVNADGVWAHTGNTLTDITNQGDIKIATGGAANFTDTDIAGNGKWTNGDSSLHFFGTCMISGDPVFSGRTVVEDQATLTIAGAVKMSGTLAVIGDLDTKGVEGGSLVLQNGAILDLSQGTLLDSTGLSVAAGATASYIPQGAVSTDEEVELTPANVADVIEGNEAYNISGTISAGAGVDESNLKAGLTVTLYKKSAKTEEFEATQITGTTTKDGAVVKYIIENVPAGIYKAVIGAAAGQYAKSESEAFEVKDKNVTTGANITLVTKASGITVALEALSTPSAGHVKLTITDSKSATKVYYKIVNAVPSETPNVGDSFTVGDYTQYSAPDTNFAIDDGKYVVAYGVDAQDKVVSYGVSAASDDGAA